MLEASHATPIADRYALGADAVLSGPTARGEQGQMWKLQTSLGTWAVKEPFKRRDEADIVEATAFQEAADAAGVPLPAIVRTVDGRVLADIADTQVRVYEWIDFDERDCRPRPRRRRVSSSPRSTMSRSAAANRSIRGSPIRSAPIGGTSCVEHSPQPGLRSPSSMAEFRHEWVALEELLEPPADLRTCHRDLWADNVRRTTDR